MIRQLYQAAAEGCAEVVVRVPGLEGPFVLSANNVDHQFAMLGIDFDGIMSTKFRRPYKTACCYVEMQLGQHGSDRIGKARKNLQLGFLAPLDPGFPQSIDLILMVFDMLGVPLELRAKSM